MNLIQARPSLLKDKILLIHLLTIFRWHFYPAWTVLIRHGPVIYYYGYKKYSSLVGMGHQANNYYWEAWQMEIMYKTIIQKVDED